jgi:hypothetical protein
MKKYANLQSIVNVSIKNERFIKWVLSDLTDLYTNNPIVLGHGGKVVKWDINRFNKQSNNKPMPANVREVDLTRTEKNGKPHFTLLTKTQSIRIKLSNTLHHFQKIGTICYNESTNESWLEKQYGLYYKNLEQYRQLDYMLLYDKLNTDENGFIKRIVRIDLHKFFNLYDSTNNATNDNVSQKKYIGLTGDYWKEYIRESIPAEFLPEKHWTHHHKDLIITGQKNRCKKTKLYLSQGVIQEMQRDLTFSADSEKMYYIEYNAVQDLVKAIRASFGMSWKNENNNKKWKKDITKGTHTKSKDKNKPYEFYYEKGYYLLKLISESNPFYYGLDVIGGGTTPEGVPLVKVTDTSKKSEFTGKKSLNSRTTNNLNKGYPEGTTPTETQSTQEKESVQETISNETTARELAIEAGKDVFIDMLFEKMANGIIWTKEEERLFEAAFL